MVLAKPGIFSVSGEFFRGISLHGKSDFYMMKNKKNEGEKWVEKQEETDEKIADMLLDSLNIEPEMEQNKTVKCHRGKERHYERRIKSELALEQELPWHFENGASYHCISFGDVDSLTYLRCIVKQQKLKYLLLSTWCMAITDAE